MTDTQCQHCRHYTGEDGDIGQCRRYPPESIDDPDDDSLFVIVFPFVRSDLWCGEFSRLVN